MPQHGRLQTPNQAENGFPDDPDGGGDRSQRGSPPNQRHAAGNQDKPSSRLLFGALTKNGHQVDDVA
jgi:hypothetical protein